MAERITLEQIRLTKDFESLKPAIRQLCDDMQFMTYGEFQAYKRTLEAQAIKVGITLDDLNNYAVDYQQLGD